MNGNKSSFCLGKKWAKTLLMVLAAALLISAGFTGCAPDSAEAGANDAEKVPVDIVAGMADDEKEKNALEKQMEKVEKKAALLDEKKTEEQVSPEAISDKASDSEPQDDGGGVKPAPVDGNYFADALFIGDSRMQGFMLYSGVEATGYTESGLDVSTVLTKPFVRYNGSCITVPQALGMSTFGKIYITLGMNELGWIDTGKFIAKYGAVIDQLKALQPNAKIYIEAILPVTEEKHSKGTTVNNNRIAEYNGLISTMAKEKGIEFIDASPPLCDEKGFLRAEATTDGVHLNKEYCQLWYGYLLEHK